MNNEVWKQITDYPNYFISNTGKVRNAKTGRELQQCLNHNGYLQIILCKSGKTKCVRVHRLVAQEFIPNPDNLDTVDHKNGLKCDNRVENLQWLSNHDNLSRFHREQATEEWKEHHKANSKESIKKAQETCKKPVICIETGKIYESCTIAGKVLGVDNSSIGKVCKGKLGSVNGLHFRFLF